LTLTVSFFDRYDLKKDCFIQSFFYFTESNFHKILR